MVCSVQDLHDERASVREAWPFLANGGSALAAAAAVSVWPEDGDAMRINNRGSGAVTAV